MRLSILLTSLLAIAAHLQAEKLPVKVVIVALFERGAVTGDAPGEFQLWAGATHSPRSSHPPTGIETLLEPDDQVLGMVTGIGTAKAASSIMAVGLDPRLFSKTYWLLAGISDTILPTPRWEARAGSTGSSTAISLTASIYERLQRDGPPGVFLFAQKCPRASAQPARGSVFHLNEQLTEWAYALTADTRSKMTEALAQRRKRFPDSQTAAPPFVTKGILAAMNYWHGAIKTSGPTSGSLDRWAR